MDNIKIFAFIGTQEHTNDLIFPGDAVLLRANDKKEQEALMREVALAIRGDVVKLSNGLYMIITADR